ncbi:MAG: hypothetical protein C0476_11975 [Sphingomonas sp.]|nr:hypothetical protein [Sphingomonas sp.]
MAGLSAAVALARHGWKVALTDSAAQAGGRCRSYHDPQLGRVIDNGNHLVLAGNQAVARYLKTIGASDRVVGPASASFEFVDLADGARWTIRPNDGPVPWWLLDAGRRVPGTGIAPYAALGRLLIGRKSDRVSDRIALAGPLARRLIDPVLLSALNTDPREGSARLAAAVIKGSLARGGRASAPRIAEPTLAAAFIDPALAWLALRGGKLATGTRLRALVSDGERVTGLDFGAGVEPVHGAVILAVPPWVAQSLIPGLSAPTEFRSIVNAHFAFAPPPGTPAMIGVIGGTTEWIFAFDDRISVTVSGADRLIDHDREGLARIFWGEIARIHSLPDELPPWQIVKEKRATFAATPEQDSLRPGAVTRYTNLFLAGDWTQTGLPATIEGAIRSGETAARLARQAALV